jgi:putative transposase
MKTFNTEKPNTFYYVTAVTYDRIPVFRYGWTCHHLIAVLAEVRRRFPYKLVAYVIMPDHFHAIVNPIDADISKWLLRVRGNTARNIINELKSGREIDKLASLNLESPQKRNHRYALWQKDPFVVDLISHKFLIQKSGYIHANPVRAGLIDHPAKWQWSSYHAYPPHAPGDIPIEVDRKPYWTEEELDNYQRTSGGSPTLNDR